uniref:Integrase catalytic domain-containing protein n=1 Tax=Loa loa TaxID=7209 RepID=A0A1I7VM44_LOALO
MLRRFISRRGYPERVLSDNASQFQVVFKAMKEQEHIRIGKRTLTLIVEIEGVLNTRSLTYASSDDCKIIRPIDFIHSSASLIIPTVDDEQDEFKPGNFDTRERIIKYWLGTLKVLDIFWEIWKKDYLMSLRERTQKEHVNPKGTENRKPREEIVLVDEPKTPRDL